MTDAYRLLLDDVAAGHAAVAAAVTTAVSAGGAGAVLALATPSEGWDVRDQLSHLAGFDESATLSLEDPERFRQELRTALDAGVDLIGSYTDRGRAMSAEEVLSWWLGARERLLGAASTAEPRARVPWYGPDMSVMSFLTARLMETWAHGVDITDAMGLVPEVSDRLRHVAHIGVSARAFSYLNRGLEPSSVPVRVVLSAPSGATWTWGPEGARDLVEGPAADFCLLVTQRRHRVDLDLHVQGTAAEEWMGIAQAFAGPPGPGRPPLSPP